MLHYYLKSYSLETNDNPIQNDQFVKHNSYKRSQNHWERKNCWLIRKYYIVPDPISLSNGRNKDHGSTIIKNCFRISLFFDSRINHKIKYKLKSKILIWNIASLLNL